MVECLGGLKPVGRVGVHLQHQLWVSLPQGQRVAGIPPGLILILIRR